MATYKLSAFISLLILHVAYGCEHMEPVYSPENVNVTFSFSARPVNTGLYVFTREYENGTSITLILMYPDRLDERINSITFIGDISTGNISLLYTDVNKSEAGVYRLSRFGIAGDFTPQCVSLVILGIPAVPTVAIARIPVEGEDVVLTCSDSRSTTVPAGQNMPMVYIWIVDDVINPDNRRYKYTANGEQLTIKNVSSTDTEKQITCRAKEDVKGGLSSVNSKVVSLQVYYGPDKAVINEGQHLNVTEGTHHDNITCTSDCYPSCTSSWISITGGSADISGDVLSLGQVTRNKTGQYKCTASNTALSYSRTAEATIDITVHYAPDVTAKVLPSTYFVENNSTELKCNANGVPSNYNYIALTQTFGGKTIPNPRPPISTMSLHSSLRFDALRLEDTGTYTCVVNNGVRDVAGLLNQISTIEILVQVSPKIFAEELTFVGTISGDVRINVPFYSFPPADSVSFTRQDGVQIQNNNRTTVSYDKLSIMTKFYGEDVILNGSIAYLQITDIQETDFTSYIVEVTNRIGRHLTVINLRNKGESATQTSPNTGPNIGPIVGGVVGSVIVLGVGVVVGIFLFRRRNRKLRSDGNSSHEKHGTAREGPYTSMQYSADTGSEYLEINREHGQLQTGDKNVYVNLQLNVQ